MTQGPTLGEIMQLADDYANAWAERPISSYRQRDALRDATTPRKRTDETETES